MRNGYFGIFRSIALVAMIALAFNLLGGVILVILYGVNIKAGSPSVIVLVNSVAQLLMMLGLPIIIARSAHQNYFAAFRLEGMSETRLPVHLLAIPIVTLAQIVGQGLASLWMIGLSQFPDLYSSLQAFQKTIDDMMNGLTTAHTTSEFVILLFGVAVVPAFAEESFFRGFIQTNIERSGKGKSRPIVALLITSVLFAALHASPLEFPGLLAIGLALGWLAYRTCDLRVSALAHAFNNGAIVVMAFLLKDEKTVESLTGTNAMPLSDTLSVLAVSIPLLLGLLYIFQRLTEPIEARGNADRVLAQYELAIMAAEEEIHPL
ncbi:MAG: CPBP family intramembrane metalloprotease [Bacteroidota bacterium]|nr:CPBP family intramembrane metalloprotease [Bacteroidota bacterium]